MTLLRRPLVHFALLGALLYGAERVVVPGIAPAAAVVHESDEELLLREALRQGLDRTDPVARERLVRNMRFALEPTGRAATDEQLLAQARALGMAQRDVVVRHRLIQAMERRLVGEARVDAAELAAFVARNPERYAAPERFTVRHLFFSHDTRAAAAEDAAAALARANDGADVTADPFLLGAELKLASAEELARLLGADFASAVREAAAGTWTGPVPSPYGAHLVFVADTRPARPADLAGAGSRAAYALAHEREREKLRQEVAALRARAERR